MIRLYLDEDSMSRALIGALRAQQLDVLSVSEAMRRTRTDPEQLTFATAEGRSICTGNVGDYAQLHAARLAAGDAHAGIIIITPDPRISIGDQARALTNLCQQRTPEDMANRIEFLTAWLE